MRPFACHKLLCSVGIFFILGFTDSLSAQNSERITLTLNNASLQKVITAIEAQTSYRFVYTNEQLQETNSVSISVKDMPLRATLEQCFRDQPLDFSLEEKYIILSKKQSNNKSELIDITGIVKNDRGDPVIGATVSITSSDRATSSASDGSFSFKQISSNAILIFSGTDVETREMPLRGQKNLSVVLKTKTKSIDEVQVIAYGTTTKRLNTGDVSMVRSEIISEQPVNNTLEALEGRVPGLVIIQAMGIAGGGFTVQIRGRNSIGSGNDPLYIIDGIPYPSVPLGSQETSSGTIKGGNALSSINPSDIESVSILKDADATSIYGSRGANGVVLITTKKGKAGKTRADASFYIGSGQITRKMNLLNTPQYLQMRREAFENDGKIPNPATAPDLITWDTTRYTDWQKELIGNAAQIVDAQASVSGGNKNTQFLFGMGYHRETTVFPGDFGNRRLSGKLNLSHISDDQRFKISAFVAYSSFDNNLYNLDLTMSALTLPPDTPPVYDSTGKLNWAGGKFNNPYAGLEQKYTGNTGNLISHADLSYQLSTHFQLILSGGYNNIQVNEILTNPASSYNPRFGITSGYTAFSDNNLKTWILEPQVQYKTSFFSGSLQILAGGTFEQDILNGQSIYGFGFSNDALLGDLQAASSISVSSYTYSNYKYEALFGRINYNWQDRYLINLTGRRDGSSRFGPGNQFANFGAVGLGWIFSKTAWLQKNIPVISFGKIRSSYGTTGNDQIGDYQYLDTYSPTQYAYMGTTGLVSNRLNNPNYSWETNRKFELGIELNFLRDRIGSSVNWYHNRSSNQLVGYPLPQITGESSIQQNLPATVQNTGWEFELNVTPVKTGKFQWTSSVNLTIPANKLIAYPNLEGSAYANTYIVGQSLYTKKNYHNTGVDSKTGIYSFEDVNMDGNLSYPEDLTAYKKIAPEYYGGFQNTFEYGGFRLDFLFQFVKQTGRNYLYATYNAPGMMYNQPDLVLNHWQTTGELRPVQKYTQDYGSLANTAYNNSVNFGDNTIGDASFIRLKNISLSYSFRSQTLQKLHASSCTLFLQGQNLLTITNYQGLDPENRNITVLPPLRILSIGFRSSF
jgi:TonB-linked SusC/RagA family outer membrane protein